MICKKYILKNDVTLKFLGQYIVAIVLYLLHITHEKIKLLQLSFPYE